MESFFQKHQEHIENALKNFVLHMGDPSPVREACAYALLNGGKRVRPLIVLLVAEALNANHQVMPAALAIECFHTASLVADDLPCMDDDDLRRSKPSLHKTYNEALALLVSYALIAAGYGAIAEAGNFSNNERAVVLALENASYNTGLWGASGGQFMDLFPSDLKEETVRLTLHRKTVSLFEISFVFGWLFGGGAPSSLDVVKKAAAHFGMAFQMVDDLEDLQQDKGNERSVNVASIFGLDKAKNMFHVELQQYFQLLEQLNIASTELMALGESLLTRVEMVVEREEHRVCLQ